MKKKGTGLTIVFDDAPLHSAHAHRGIGAYTRALIKALRNKPNTTVLLASETAQNRHKTQADITHYPLFDLFFPTLPIAFGKKTVVTIHDTIPLLYPKHYEPGLRGRLALYRQRFALLFVSGVVTVSEKSKTDIVQQLRVPAQKVFVAYNGNNPEIVAQKPKVIAAVTKKYNLPNKYVLYVGDINYNKNIPQLIKMMKFLPEEYHLVCVGKQFVEQDIPEWRWIEAQVAMSDIADRVHFITDLPITEPTDLAALYSGAAVYVQPSLYEGFGLPIIEAMHCLCPVVSSNGGALPEIGGDAALYAQPTAEDLAAQVMEVLSWSIQERKRRVQKAHSWAKRYTWQKTATKLLELYTTLVHRS